MAVTSSRHLLVRACLGEQVERTPVWAMRQAGRWDPEFRKLRGALDFYSFSSNPELSAAASLCPRRFGVDGIILFYDITTLAVAMGQRFHLAPKRGPVPEHPIRTMADVQRLTANPDVAEYRYLFDMLRLVLRELDGSLPVLVFAGAPYTLATYMIGTGKETAATQTFARENGEVWGALLDRIADATIGFLRSLLDAGADVYQLFDSWAGTLDRSEYIGWAHDRHVQVFSEVAAPSILFVKDCPFLELAATSGARVLSVGKHHDLAAVKEQWPSLCFQGNVDHELLIYGSAERVIAQTASCLRVGGGHRHILNLDHGMDPAAKPTNFEAFVNTALSG